MGTSVGCGDDGGGGIAPDTVLDSVPSALSREKRVSITFHATSNANGFVCSLDGATPSPCISAFEADVTDGEHTFEVSAAMGKNVDETPAMHTWRVDATAPDTTLVMGPPALDNTVDPAITFTGTDPGGGAVTFECKLDSGVFAACSSPDSLNVTDGVHAFEVRAVDAAGNVDPTPAMHGWTVDTTTPDTTIVMGPAPVSTTLPDVTFTFSSPVADVTFECSLDGAAFVACTSPQVFNDLPDGMHTFVVRAKSAAGTVDPSPATRTWTVDGTAPSVMITAQPTNPSNDSTPTFSFTSPDSTATFECRIDAGTFAPCTSAFTSATLADGMHTFHVRAKDGVGNIGTADTYTWTIDTMAPTVAITSGPTGLIAVATASYAFTTTGSPTAIECQLDTGAFAACTSPRAYTAIADGAHVFTVRVTDAAGNTGMDMRMFTVDTTGPVVTITAAPTNPTADSTPTFMFTVTGMPMTTQCSVDGGAFATCASPFTTATLSDASHTVVVRATDAAGNAGSDMRTFTVDTTGPTVTIVNRPANPTNATTASFTFTVSEGSPMCRLDGAAFAACTSPRNFTGLAAGSHTFTVQASDALGNTGSASYTWVIDTTPPTVTITSMPMNPTNATTASFNFTVSEGTPQCRLDGGAFAACTSPRVYTALADGSHTFTVQATDAVGNVGMASYTWVIDATVPVVTLTNLPANPTMATTANFMFTISEGTAMCRLDAGAFAACTSPRALSGLADGSHTFTVQATDAVGNIGTASHTWVVDTMAPTVTLSNTPSNPTAATTASIGFTVSEGSPQCKLDMGAFAACTSPRALSGLTHGSHTFTVQASDVAGNVGSASYTWFVDTMPPMVMILTAPSNPSNSTTATFTFSVSDGTIECQIDGGAFSTCATPKTYLGLGDGSHTFTVRSTDAVGRVGSATHTWVIDATGPVITFSARPPARWPVNYYDFTWSANESATYECSVNNGVSWVACSTPFGIPNVPAGFPAATYNTNNTFSVRGRDSLNNVGAAVTHTWAPANGLVLHYPFEQGARQNTSLLAQRPAYSPGVAGAAPAVGGWAGTALRHATSATYAGTRRPLTSSAAGVYMGGMWVREWNDLANGTLWTNVDASGLWGHTVTINGTGLRLTVLENGQAFTVQGSIPFNVWAHVGVRTTGPSKGLELMVNGVTVAHAMPPSATGFEAGQGDLRIGQVTFLDIDDVRFYNTLVNSCTTFVRGQVPASGGQCVANAPALEFDFEGTSLGDTGTMSIGRSNPMWTAFAGRLGEGFTLGSPQVPFQMTNFAQQQPLIGHSITMWVPGSGQSDTVFDFTRPCSFAANFGTCGIGVVWTDNRQFFIFAGVPGTTAAQQQQITVPAAPLSGSQTHNLVITEQRTANGTQSLRIYVNGRLEGTLSYAGGDVFATRNDTIRSCGTTGCSIDEIELWPQDLSANAEMLCENGFDGQWDPAVDRCNFTSND
ncbi:MAG: hypothetical protein H0T46_19915 [Deltaproteobacteria bacterium]|nr:hypothetical protein [Deltaproteobacteria bacterium]